MDDPVLQPALLLVDDPVLHPAGPQPVRGHRVRRGGVLRPGQLRHHGHHGEQLGAGLLASEGGAAGSWQLKQLGSDSLVCRVSGARWAGRWSTGLTTRAGRGQVTGTRVEGTTSPLSQVSTL